MNTNIKIFLSVIGLLILGAIFAVIMNANKVDVPGKYDAFTQCLKDKETNFYGAFWCLHCKKQKALFEDSVKLLPYVECSTPDASNQTQVCIDKKIESYPTWTFITPIKFAEKAKPVVCTKDPGLPTEDAVCDDVRSQYATVWVFPKFQISTILEPIHEGDNWTFDPSSQLRGEIQLEELANQTGCVLPQ